MNKILVLLTLTFGSTTMAAAQTKRIAHLSHSGTGTFVITNSKDNFGIPSPDKRKTPPQADTIAKKKPAVHYRVKKSSKSRKSKTTQAGK